MKNNIFPKLIKIYIQQYRLFNGKFRPSYHLIKPFELFKSAESIVKDFCNSIYSRQEDYEIIPQIIRRSMPPSWSRGKYAWDSNPHFQIFSNKKGGNLYLIIYFSN